MMITIAIGDAEVAVDELVLAAAPVAADGNNGVARAGVGVARYPNCAYSVARAAATAEMVASAA